MKTLIKFSLPFWMMILSIVAFSQTVILPSHWKFRMADDTTFIQPAFNDADWDSVTVPMGWEKLGINKERSIGWYRVEFNLPANLVNTDLVLFAGAIDDADETYFNGHLIGRSGKFPPGDQTAWDVERQYNIKKEWVKKKNSIAIRVYNGIGGGGIYSGRIMILSKKERDRQLADQLRKKTSYYQLTTSNGLIAAVYNEQTRLVENLYPHIFSYYDSGVAVKPVLSNLKLNKDIIPLSSSYLENTHIIEVKYPSFTLYYFSSFTRADKIFYVLATGKEENIKDIDFVFEQGAGKISTLHGMLKKGAIAEKYFLFGFADTLNALPDMQTALQQISKADLLQQELKFMKNVFTSCKIPAAISVAERNTMKESIAVLKMSQVSDHEIFPLSHGQVVASLRPGVWAISWVRDASFAIEAMSKLGMYVEAKKALEFMLNAKPTDQYIHYIHSDGKDYGIAVPYIISVTRYFGNGREESDYSADGPNIEIDDFGLFLTAFYHYVNESGDKAFFEKWKDAIDKIGDAIIHNINDKNIIRRESGPWEHHLPGKEFMWTSGVGARGLQLIASLQKKYQQPYQKFEKGYQRLYSGIFDNCVINGKYIKGNATEQRPSDHHYFDAATFELFANGLITDPKLFASHMKEYDTHNRVMNDASRGYIRFNSEDSYENQEWPFAGLRVSVAQKKMGNKAEAKRLIDRITMFANKNNNLIPEILSNDLSMYRGAIPMVGYGAGAYILAVLSFYKNN
jgi:GH15 family glucan-1,4-alpha-glucosidase